MEFLTHQLDQPIFILRVVGWHFSFYSNFDKFGKQTVGTLISSHILWHLIWVCTVCLCPAKRTLNLYGLILCHKSLQSFQMQTPEYWPFLWYHIYWIIHNWAVACDFQHVWYVRPAKAQTSLRICAVCSEPLLVTWLLYDC